MIEQLIRNLWVVLVGNGGAVGAVSYDTLPDDDDTTLTAGAGADTFGSYSALAASVGSADVWECGVYISNASAQTDFKVAIATGAAGSETDRFTMPYTAIQADTPFAFSLPFPIRIPSGTRLAGRCKSGDTAARTLDVVGIHALGVTA